MFRVLVLIESVTIAHVVRPLQIAKELRNDGVEVLFGASERYKHILEREDFKVYPLFSAPHEVLLDAVRRVDFKEQNKFLPMYLQSDIALIKEAGGVDLVLSDFRFMAKYAARACGVPHAALVNGFFTPHYAIAPELPRAVMPKAPAWVRLNKPLRYAAKKIIPRLYARPYQKTCEQNGIKDVRITHGFDFSVSDSLTLICDLPEFTPHKNMPDHYQFIGPVLWEPEDGYSELPEDLDAGGRTIYVSLGTSGEVTAFREIIKALARLPYRVLLSTGGAEVPELPPNILAVPFVKPSGILKKASLMICHGGNGSIYQALSMGVPVLCITSFYDQEWNGQRVRELGLGESVFHSDVTAELMDQLIPKLVETDIFRRRTQEFQPLFQNWNGARAGADHLLNLLESKLPLSAKL